MHDALTIGIPLVAILAGILLNRQDTTSLRSDLRAEVGSVRSEINSLRSEMHTRFDAIHRDMREFYAEQARHDVRITKLEQSKDRH